MGDSAPRVENVGVCTMASGVVVIVYVIVGIGVLVLERGCPVREARKTPGRVVLLSEGTKGQFSVCSYNKE